jgi:hypothetical protein
MTDKEDQNDRELLELAAKATGLEIRMKHYEVGGWHCQWHHVIDKGIDEWIDWNPLTDDGDALRLAVKLQLKIEHYSLTSDGFDRVGAGHGNAPIKYENDPYAAARRAITRAAAEIGKTLKK